MPIRRLIAMLVGASLPLLWSTAALAHAVIQPGNAPAGTATEFQVLIPHGCSEGEPPPPPGSVVEPTRLVSVLLPEGVDVSALSDAPGFSAEQTDETLTWSGGSLESEDIGEFFFTATLDGEDGDVLTFDVYQECTDELSYRWSSTSAATPAPTIAIGDEAAGHDHEMDDMDAVDEDHDADEMDEMADDDHHADEMDAMDDMDDDDHDADEMDDGEAMATTDEGGASAAAGVALGGVAVAMALGTVAFARRSRL